MEYFLRVIHVTVKYLLYKIKLLESWLVLNPEIHKSIYEIRDSTSSVNAYYSLMNFAVNNHKHTLCVQNAEFIINIGGTYIALFK
jgi:hypothetical protein